MTQERLRQWGIGDRVQSRTRLGAVRAQTPGSIVRVYVSTGYCGVRFDGHEREVRLAHPTELEPERPAHAARR